MSTDPQPSPKPITHLETEAGGAFVVLADGGARIAEMTYARRDGVAVIDHTWVDDSLRGQGIARRLLDAAVAWARATKTPVAATCPYAKGQFEKDASLRDVLAS